MTTKHKLIATIPVGDPDLGAEQECEITFTCLKGSPDYYNKAGGHWEQGWGAEIEFVSAAPYCNGKPAPFYGAFADMEQASLDGLADAWLSTDDGQAEAMETVAADDDTAREYAAELRRMDP